MIVVAEQLCVRRELQTDLDVQYTSLEAGDTMEMIER